MKVGIGIDVGGTNIKFSIINQSFEIQDSWSIKTNLEHKGELILEDISLEILGYLSKTELTNEEIDVIGIGVPGPVDSDTGTVEVAVNLGWGKKEVSKILNEKLNLPVYVLNDANAAAFGEKTQMSKDITDLIFITLGTGVGGGIIQKGNLLVGPHYSAGEIGHIPLLINNENRTCGCGNINCLETFASANGLIHTAKIKYKRNGASNVEDITAEKFFEDLKKNKNVAKEVMEEYTEQLATGIASAVNTLDTQAIVIGGGLSNAGEILLTNLKRSLMPKIFPRIREKLLVELAKLGNNAGSIGAVAYGRERKKGV